MTQDEYAEQNKTLQTERGAKADELKGTQEKSSAATESAAGAPKTESGTTLKDRVDKGIQLGAGIGDLAAKAKIAIASAASLFHMSAADLPANGVQVDNPPSIESAKHADISPKRENGPENPAELLDNTVLSPEETKAKTKAAVESSQGASKDVDAANARAPRTSAPESNAGAKVEGNLTSTWNYDVAKGEVQRGSAGAYQGEKPQLQRSMSSDVARLTDDGLKGASKSEARNSVKADTARPQPQAGVQQPEGGKATKVLQAWNQDFRDARAEGKPRADCSASADKKLYSHLTGSEFKGDKADLQKSVAGEMKSRYGQDAAAAYQKQAAEKGGVKPEVQVQRNAQTDTKSRPQTSGNKPAPQAQTGKDAKLMQSWKQDFRSARADGKQRGECAADADKKLYSRLTGNEFKGEKADLHKSVAGEMKSQYGPEAATAYQKQAAQQTESKAATQAQQQAQTQISKKL